MDIRFFDVRFGAGVYVVVVYLMSNVDEMDEFIKVDVFEVVINMVSFINGNGVKVKKELIVVVEGAFK